LSTLPLRILILACLLPLSCAQPAPEPVATSLDDLDSFAGDYFPRRMEELHIPGLAFVAVRDGEILLAEGYGKASLEEGRDIDPATTVFRVGSVSKVFVAIAVMQLVEKGQLDLYTDVNQYLRRFQVDNPYPVALTLEHLLTHVGGIHDPPYETYAEASDRQPLGLFLANDLPPVTTPPGEEYAYSSNGYALAAYMVEEATGTPFDAYVEDNILEPLGMSDTGYLLDPPDTQEMAMGYARQGASYVPQPLDYDDDYPSGSLVSTAHDMALFLTALLHDGCLGEVCILEAATVADLQRARAETSREGFQQTPGLVEGFIQGQRVLGYSGAIKGFGAALGMYPEHDVGYFFAFNAECYLSSACDIVPEFREVFAECLAP
jgi:CubicO group peptidase (beta-lactamase class C family)